MDPLSASSAITVEPISLHSPSRTTKPQTLFLLASHLAVAGQTVDISDSLGRSIRLALLSTLRIFVRRLVLDDPSAQA